MDSLSVNQPDAAAAAASPVSADAGAAVIAAGTDQLANQPFGTPITASSLPTAPPLPALDTTPQMNLAAPTPLPSDPSTPPTVDGPVPPPAPPPPPPPPPPPVASLPRRRPLGVIIAIVVVVLLLLGGGGYWWYTHYRVPKPAAAPSKPAIALVLGSPTGLGQEDSQGNTLAGGGTVTTTAITMQFTLNTAATTGSATPQVEVVPFGQNFTGQTVISGTAVAADGKDLTMNVTDSKLASGQYHWRARVKVGQTTGAWTNFGSGQGPDFIVAAATAAAAPPTASMAGQAATSNQTLTITGNQPTIAGQAGEGDTIAIVIGPENIALSGTADSSGAWSITPSAALPSGNHTVQITATNSAGTTSQLSFNLTINPVSNSSTTPPAKLAPTGDPVGLVSLVALGLLALALAGLRLIRSHE